MPRLVQTATSRLGATDPAAQRRLGHMASRKGRVIYTEAMPSRKVFSIPKLKLFRLKPATGADDCDICLEDWPGRPAHIILRASRAPR